MTRSAVLKHASLGSLGITTDNEACFTSRFFTLGLSILGIKHKRTNIASPWENGRIERFFGTLKSKIKQLDLTQLNTIQDELTTFQIWYNQLRPHQSLQGFTPIEVWKNKTQRHSTKTIWINEWHGLLTGYYFFK